MSRFDKEPDGDIHGECANEIHGLRSRIDQLEKLITQEQKRSGRIGTLFIHSNECHMWGHHHYECLLRKFKEAQKGHARYEPAPSLHLRFCSTYKLS